MNAASNIFNRSIKILLDEEFVDFAAMVHGVEVPISY